MQLGLPTQPSDKQCPGAAAAFWCATQKKEALGRCATEDASQRLMSPRRLAPHSWGDEAACASDTAKDPRYKIQTRSGQSSNPLFHRTEVLASRARGTHPLRMISAIQRTRQLHMEQVAGRKHACGAFHPLRVRRSRSGASERTRTCIADAENKRLWDRTDQ
jgi:hypothetical protein